MGFKAGRFGDYGKLGVIANDQWIEDDQEMRQAGNCAWDYSASNRLIGAGISKNCDELDAMGRTWTLDGTMGVKILEFPLSRVAYGASGMIRFNLIMERSTTQTIQVQASVIGGGSTRYELSGAIVTRRIVSINVEVPEQHSSSFKNDLSVSLYLFSTNITSTDVTIYSIGIFEPQRMPLRVAKFEDTTGAGNTIGVDDWPLSTAARCLLRDQQEVLHWARAAKANILSQCFASGYLVGTDSYSTNSDALGAWIVRKPYGGTNVKFVTKIITGAHNTIVKASLWSLSKIAYDNETDSFHAGDILINETSGGVARIVSVDDDGTTGYLHLSYVFGSFENNGTLHGINSETGISKGEALQNGSITSGEELDSDDDTVLALDDRFVYLDLDTIDEDSEYEIRLDAKGTSISGCVVLSTSVSAYVENDTSISNKLPRSSWHEQDDPIRARPYKSIKDTQNATWHNNRAVILSDFRVNFSDGYSHPTEKQRGRTASEANADNANFAFGIVYKSNNCRSITARITVSKSILDRKRKIPVSSASGTLERPYAIVTGSTSGAVAIAEYLSDSTTDYLYIDGDSTSFVTGETLSTPAWSATADGPPQLFSGSQTVKFSISHNHLSDVSSSEVYMSLANRGSPYTFEVTLPVDTDEFNNDSSVISNHPLLWAIQAWTDDSGDPIILEQYQVFQEPGTTLDAELYEDQTE